MLSMFDLPLDEAVYTFVTHEGEPTHIAASSLLAAAKASGMRTTYCELGGTLVKALERNDLGVEIEHALKLVDAALEVPLLVCEWGERDHIIADGAHRLWRRWKRGDTNFHAYVIPEPVWRMFTIYDIPGSGAMWDTFNRTVKVRS